jgi:hypothetical protein
MAMIDVWIIHYLEYFYDNLHIFGHDWIIHYLGIICIYIYINIYIYIYI